MSLDVVMYCMLSVQTKNAGMGGDTCTQPHPNQLYITRSTQSSLKHEPNNRSQEGLGTQLNLAVTMDNFNVFQTSMGYCAQYYMINL